MHFTTVFNADTSIPSYLPSSTGGKFVWACASKMSHAIAWNTRNACLQKGTIV
jgi:hypothetical protein